MQLPPQLKHLFTFHRPNILRRNRKTEKVPALQYPQDNSCYKEYDKNKELSNVSVVSTTYHKCSKLIHCKGKKSQKKSNVIEDHTRNILLENHKTGENGGDMVELLLNCEDASNNVRRIDNIALEKLNDENIVEDNLIQSESTLVLEAKPLQTQDTNATDLESCYTKKVKKKGCKCKCGKTFTNPRKLSKHKTVHLKEESMKLACPALINQEVPCDVILHSREELKNHVNNGHTFADAPFLCSKCPRRFFWRVGLIAHTRFHLFSASPYICPWQGCNKQFAVACRLKEHVRSHTGDRPYHCPFANCKLSFRSASKLERHSRVHKNAYHYSCPVCNKKFVRRDTMREHCHDKHFNSNQLLECSIEGCSYAFRNKYLLYRHIKRTHKIVEAVNQPIYTSDPKESLLKIQEISKIKPQFNENKEQICETDMLNTGAMNVEENLTSVSLCVDANDVNSIDQNSLSNYFENSPVVQTYAENYSEPVNIIYENNLAKDQLIQTVPMEDESHYELLRNIKIERITNPIPIVEQDVTYPIYNQTVHHHENYKIELFEANESVENVQNCHAARTNKPWPFRRYKRTKKSQQPVRSETQKQPSKTIKKAELPNSYIISEDNLTLVPEMSLVNNNLVSGSFLVSDINAIGNYPVLDANVVMLSSDSCPNIDNAEGFIADESEAKSDVNGLELILLHRNESRPILKMDPTLGYGLNSETFTTDSMDAGIPNAELMLTEDGTNLGHDLEFLTNAGDFFQEELMYADTNNDESAFQVLLLRGE